MIESRLRIATRKSPLALWQAEHVKERLEHHHPGLEVELLPISTTGDQLLDQPLSQVGGKGLFLKELERALLDGEADLAVHSMKDVPPVLPSGLGLIGIMQRETPFDAFVSNQYTSLDSLPQGAIVGTASLRRSSQLLAQRPDLQITLLRGNLQTRLKKLDSGEYDAIVLACAGLERLGLDGRIRQTLNSTQMVPAAGQGALGLEARLNNPLLAQLVQPLICAQSQTCVEVERIVTQRLGGSCSVPIGAYATLQAETLTLEAIVGQVDGSQLLRSRHSAPLANADQLGETVADDLINQGADTILATLQQ